MNFAEYIINLSQISMSQTDLAAWVGGIGSFSAAVVALFVAGSEKRRSKKYAKYLFESDLRKLYPFVERLREVAKSMIAFSMMNSSEPDQEEAMEAERETWKYLEKFFLNLSGDLEYFGKSERLFSYFQDSEKFKNLEIVVNELLEFNEKTNQLFRYVEEDEVAKYVNELADKLELRLKTFFPDQQPSM